MGRSVSQAIHTPGATAAPDSAGSVDHDTTATQDQDASVVGQAERIAKLEAENAKLRAVVSADAKLPQVVYEPQTPHGAQRLAASATGDMTVAEVMQAIAEGRMVEPVTNYLCRDGYYCRSAG